jgi:peptidoglycan hydrolase-like protein with peptidoglycan-binding domain
VAAVFALQSWSSDPSLGGLQAILQRVWFSSGRIHDNYLTKVLHAVTRFQAANGLPQTGVVDEATWSR